MTDQNEIIKKFQTSCKPCIFAESQSNNSKQTGCKLDRLNKFIDQNRTIVDNDGFFIIEGICNTCRGQQWKEANTGVNHITAVLKEVEVKIDIVLYSIDDICDNIIWKIEQALSACVKQHDIKPSSIIVVVRNSNTNFKDIYDTSNNITSQYDIPFQLVRVLEKDADVGRCIELGMNKCKHQYIATFDIEHKIPINFITKFNDLVNIEMQRILMIEPLSSYNCMILTNVLFDMLGKNYNFPIFEKVKEVAAEQRKENLIIPWSKLWNQE